MLLIPQAIIFALLGGHAIVPTATVRAMSPPNVREGLAYMNRPQLHPRGDDKVDFDKMPPCAVDACLPYKRSEIGCDVSDSGDISKSCYCNLPQPLQCAGGKACTGDDWYATEDWFTKECPDAPEIDFKRLPYCMRDCVQTLFRRWGCPTMSRVCFCSHLVWGGYQNFGDAVLYCARNNCPMSVDIDLWHMETCFGMQNNSTSTTEEPTTMTTSSSIKSTSRKTTLTTTSEASSETTSTSEASSETTSTSEPSSAETTTMKPKVPAATTTTVGQNPTTVGPKSTQSSQARCTAGSDLLRLEKIMLGFITVYMWLRFLG